MADTCSKGHEYDYFWRDRRFCSECRRAAWRACYSRNNDKKREAIHG